MMSYTFRRMGPGGVVASVGVYLSAAGCTVPAGDWELVEVDPPGTPFPFTRIQLGADGGDRAKGQFASGVKAKAPALTTSDHLDTGGGMLRLFSASHAPPGMHTRMRLDGKLVMTLQPRGRDWKVRGIFRRVQPIDPRLLDSARPITSKTLENDRVDSTEDRSDGP